MSMHVSINQLLEALEHFKNSNGCCSISRQGQVHLNMTLFIAAFKPEILDSFLRRQFIETDRGLNSVTFFNESIKVVSQQYGFSVKFEVPVKKLMSMFDCRNFLKWLQNPLQGLNMGVPTTKQTKSYEEI